MIEQTIRFRVEYQYAIDNMEFKTRIEARARKWNLKEIEIAAGYRHEEMHIFKVTYLKQEENGWVIKESVTKELIE